MDQLKCVKKSLKRLARFSFGSSRIVALKLLMADFRGTPRRAWQCPVANYLRSSCNVEVDVGSDFVRVKANVDPRSYMFSQVDTPRSVSRFIQKFDRGGYSQLDVLQDPRR